MTSWSSAPPSAGPFTSSKSGPLEISTSAVLSSRSSRSRRTEARTRVSSIPLAAWTPPSAAGRVSPPLAPKRALRLTESFAPPLHATAASPIRMKIHFMCVSSAGRDTTIEMCGTEKS